MTPTAAFVVDASWVPGHLLAASAVADHAPLIADIRNLIDGDRGSKALEGVVLAVLGARSSDGSRVEAVARRFRELHPHAGIFVVDTGRGDARLRLAGLARAGVDELFIMDEAAESDRFADLVRWRLGAPPPETALRMIGTTQPTKSMVGRVTMWLLRNAYRNPSLDDAAAHFGRHRTTLWRWILGAGLPEPGTLLRCGRLLHLMELREHGASVQLVADRLGMESAAGVRMILDRAAGDEDMEQAFERLGLRS